MSSMKNSSSRGGSSAVSATSIQQLSATSEDHLCERLLHDIQIDAADDDVTSVFGGLYTDGSLDLIIDADNDVSAVSLALPLMTVTHNTTSFCGHTFSSLPTGRQPDDTTTSLVSPKQQQQQQQQQQRLQPQDDNVLQDTSTNSDAFFYPYGSWQNGQNDGSTVGDRSPLISSMNPLIGQNKPSHLGAAGISDATTADRFESNMQSKRDQMQPPDNDHSVRSNLFVSGLRPSVTDSELHALFAPYGEIESAKIMLDIYTGKSRGIAFVKFTDVRSAERAGAALNNSIYLGESIVVRVARPHAAYHPAAPTNKTFVRNIPLGISRAELAAYFSRYGDVNDISIHSDTVQRSSTKRRNVAFITYTTNAAAARAAHETHTTMPFPGCDNIPLLAKVAEDSAHRIERLARRETCRGNENSKMKNVSGNSKNGSKNNNVANNSVWNSMQAVQRHLQKGPASGKPVGQQLAPASTPPYPFAPPIITDPFAVNGVNPAFYTAPFLPMPATAPSGPAPFLLVGSEPRSASIRPPMASPFEGIPHASMLPSKMPQVNAHAMATQQSAMMCLPSGHPVVISPQSTVMYYMPNGQVALGATLPQPQITR